MSSVLVELTSEIVAAHASVNEMTSEQMLSLIQKVHGLLKSLEEGGSPEVEAKPAVTLQPKKSIQKDQVICLICGKGGFKTLTRHIKQMHDMKPAQYRKQVGLPAGTALVAKNYSEARRASAIERNLAGNLEKARAARKAKAKPAKPAPAKLKLVKPKKAK